MVTSVFTIPFCFPPKCYAQGAPDCTHSTSPMTEAKKKNIIKGSLGTSGREWGGKVASGSTNGRVWSQGPTGRKSGFEEAWINMISHHRLAEVDNSCSHVAIVYQRMMETSVLICNSIAGGRSFQMGEVKQIIVKQVTTRRFVLIWNLLSCIFL